MTAAEVVSEYGEAFRGDWSDVDGRAVRSEMYAVAEWLRDPSSYPGDIAARGLLGLCPAGLGHWSSWCDTDCEAPA